MDKLAIETKVKETLEQLRPYLNDDGGDMEFVRVSDEGIVEVRLLGACSECSMSSMTLKAGLEEAVKKVVPEIKAVVAVNMPQLS